MAAVATAEGLAIVLLAVLVAGLLRSHAEILRRLHELGAGMDPAPGAVPGRTSVALPATPPPDRRHPVPDLTGTTP
ncbi:MAG TPA: hypothetical protein VF954_05000, partial [Acidimicrobiales bacterium]